jgi:EAL domain-containing protein (putative c-di-GMP-specific phosphodiesterase class I)
VPGQGDHHGDQQDGHGGHAQRPDPAVEFIPLAEASGLIRPLAAWVLREACRQAAERQRTTAQRDKQMAPNINLSGRQLQYPEVVDDVAAALVESGLPSDSLVLE